MDDVLKTICANVRLAEGASDTPEIERFQREAYYSYFETICSQWQGFSESRRPNHQHLLSGIITYTCSIAVVEGQVPLVLTAPVQYSIHAYSMFYWTYKHGYFGKAPHDFQAVRRTAAQWRDSAAISAQQILSFARKSPDSNSTRDSSIRNLCSHFLAGAVYDLAIRTNLF